MKKQLFLSIAILACAALSACAGSGTIKWDHARQVKAGMTQQEVVGLMGKPYSVASNPDGSVKLIWVNATAWGGASSAVMTFKDGKAIDSFHVPDDF